MEGSVSAVGIEVVVGLVLGLVLLVWSMEALSFLEERATSVVSQFKFTIRK